MHQTFTKKIICVFLEDNIHTIPPSPHGRDWKFLGVGGVVRIFHINSVREVGVEWSFLVVFKTLILPKSVETKKYSCV